MAVIKLAGGETDQGEWVPVVTGKEPDPDRDWEARIRALPEGKARKLMERYGQVERVGSGALKDRVMTAEEHRCYRRDCAEYVWTDCEKLFLLATEPAQVDLYARLLGCPVELGVPFDLHGRLNSAIKHQLLDGDSDLAHFIFQKSVALRRRQYREQREHEEALAGN